MTPMSGCARCPMPISMSAGARLRPDDRRLLRSASHPPPGRSTRPCRPVCKVSPTSDWVPPTPARAMRRADPWAGRQMLSFGSERLIGTRYGPNVPLAFDGGRAIVSLPRGAHRPVGGAAGPAGTPQLSTIAARRPNRSGAPMPRCRGGLKWAGLLLSRLSQSPRPVRRNDGIGATPQPGGCVTMARPGPGTGMPRGVVQFGRFADQSIRAGPSRRAGPPLSHRTPVTGPRLRVNMVSGDAHAGMDGWALSTPCFQGQIFRRAVAHRAEQHRQRQSARELRDGTGASRPVSPPWPIGGNRAATASMTFPAT